MNLITPANIIFRKGYCVIAEENRGSSHESLFIKKIRSGRCSFIQPIDQEALA
jgi:hypothetical protein